MRKLRTFSSVFIVFFLILGCKFTQIISQILPIQKNVLTLHRFLSDQGLKKAGSVAQLDRATAF